jgi:hypothetical protein
LGRLRVTQLPIKSAPKDTAVLNVVSKEAVDGWLQDDRMAAEDKLASTFVDISL